MSASAIDKILDTGADLIDGKLNNNTVTPGSTVTGSGVTETGYEISFAGILAARHTIKGEQAEEDELAGKYIVLTDGSVIKLKA